MIMYFEGIRGRKLLKVSGLVEGREKQWHFKGYVVMDGGWGNGGEQKKKQIHP